MDTSEHKVTGSTPVIIYG